MTSGKKVLQEQCKCYEKLYGDTDMMIELISERCDVLENPSIKTLSSILRQDCEEDLTIEVCS